MITYKGKKIYERDELPWQPNGSRIMVKPDPPDDETEAGLIIPEIAKHRGVFGHIIGAGLSARDTLHDQGAQIGDRICFGQMAGVWQEWDHVTEPGNMICDHERWNRAPCNRDKTNAFVCDSCGAKRFQEPLLIMDVDDIHGNEDLARRMDRGETSIRHGVTPGGRTQFHLVTGDTNGTIQRSSDSERDGAGSIDNFASIGGYQDSTAGVGGGAGGIRTRRRTGPKAA